MKLFDWLLSRFTVDMGIDLGTANTLITVQGDEDITLDEPSVVAVSRDSNEVLLDGEAVGDAAVSMAEKTPRGITVIRPLKNGVPADVELTQHMLRYFLRKAMASRPIVKPRLVIAIPYGTNPLEKRAVVTAAELAGAREVLLIDEPTAAAIGAGVDAKQPVGHLIVDIGGGTTEIAVLSLANVVEGECLRIAGDHFDEAIIQFIRNKYSLTIGPVTSEKLKIACASAIPLEEELEVEIRGRDALTGLPRRVVVTSVDVREALSEPLRKILDTIKVVLERTPPELSADLVQTGITMCGGGSLIRGLPQLIEREIELPTRIAPNPLQSVARGTAAIVENYDYYAPFLDRGI